MSNQPEAPVRVSFEGGIARLTLANPQRKNAISLDMAKMIDDFCNRVETDTTIGGAVVDSVGDYFCSGADTKDLAASSSQPASTEALLRTSAVYEAFVRVGTLPVPTVAAVVGGAVGAGLNLALAVDVLLVTPDCVLDSGFLARGIHPGGGHFSLLGRSLNRQQAMAIGMLGAPISGDQAVRLGLAWSAHPGDTITQEALRLLRGVSEDPDLARRIKRSAEVELGPQAVSWAAAVEVERGVQMWSLGRKTEAGWQKKPARAVAER
ncbi:enoyl-CoA hydratase-related protein [Rhodococcus qingshengii]|uniref:enoyl-CoA hydratase-related protein n=1 Tax=Rhodococcus qingshengii TaxID=334542 RepID=UPI0037C65C8A